MIEIGKNEYRHPFRIAVLNAQNGTRGLVDANNVIIWNDDILLALNELSQLRHERGDLQKRVEELIEFADDCLLCANGLIGANSTKEHESYESNFNELIVKAASLRLPSFKESPDEN